MSINEMIASFEAIATNPKKQLDECVASGRKAIGVVPYYAPEELVYATGMLPFGVWGRTGTVTRAKEYFPPFYCSMAQSTLEMGLNGELDQLSGIMIPALCDTLKCLGQNWNAGVKNVPFIFVSQPQQRATDFGRAYMQARNEDVAAKLEEISGERISEAKLEAAIKVYNAYRQAVRAFIKAVAAKPGLISASQRANVIKAARFMDKADYTAKVAELTAALQAAEAPAFTGGKVLLSGILADTPGIYAALEAHDLVVVADDLACESREVSTDAAEEGNPFVNLAQRFCDVKNCSILYDPEKGRIQMVIDRVRESGAEGVIILMAAFCDPEEFDQPLLVRGLQQAGIPVISITVDQQTDGAEQAGTAIEAFADMLAANR